MDWLLYIQLSLLFIQLPMLVMVICNYFFTIKKFKKKRGYRPDTTLIVPCKGIDTNFRKNISSLLCQDYLPYRVFFVVEDSSDHAYKELNEIIDQCPKGSITDDIRVLVAGRGSTCSQKIYNLLLAYRSIPETTEVVAFADSDIYVQNNWLSQLVYPLRKAKNGVSTGYRWFVPLRNNIASLALSCVNAKVAQLLGNTRFNQAWGGSMAVKVETFRKLEIEKIWTKALSDDLSLSVTVRKSKKKVAFVPGCIVASYESMNWGQLFEFAHRQFLITRIGSPLTWLFGLLSSFISVTGFYGSIVFAFYAASVNYQYYKIVALVPIALLSIQFTGAVLRQNMIYTILENDHKKMRFAMLADIFFFWIWTFLTLIFILSSSIGRKIRWRGITYKLLGPADTIICD